MNKETTGAKHFRLCEVVPDKELHGIIHLVPKEETTKYIKPLMDEEFKSLKKENFTNVKSEQKVTHYKATSLEEKYRKELIKAKISRLQAKRREEQLQAIITYAILATTVICGIAIASWTIIFHEKIAIIAAAIITVLGTLFAIGKSYEEDKNE